MRKSLLFLFARSTYFLPIFLCLSACLSAGCNNADREFTVIYGVISDCKTGQPLENVSVVLSPFGLTQQTGAAGTYCFENLDVQQYTLTAQKAGYQTNRKIVMAVSGERMEVNIQLTQIPQR